ncbi:hypothetical protein COF68_06050 [Bacillus toyonensis]|uniref:hypothetical protein n=1 Tax=Bacillus toyonensis TaxID=155322 RepID=UPI000BFE37B0|nr:hypothetical protein [Bacillus toyonensis]PHE64397.1 hypothetical protein COF68_06050 [Bacillus toyonensis]
MPSQKDIPFKPAVTGIGKTNLAIQRRNLSQTLKFIEDEGSSISEELMKGYLNSLIPTKPKF